MSLHLQWIADYEQEEAKWTSSTPKKMTGRLPTLPANESNGNTTKPASASTSPGWLKLYETKERTMGLTATSKNGDFEMVPAGVHVGRCFRIVDLGTQTTEWQGDKKKAHKVLLQWELLGDEKMADGRPFAVSKRYTVSTHEKSQLRKDLESWRGKPFTTEEVNAFKITKVLGVYGLLNITHAPSADGSKTFANLTSIMPLPKGMPKPEAVNPDQVFDLDDRDMNVFNALGDKLKATIMASDEWNKTKGDSFEDDIPWATQPEVVPEF